jgi:hypothetical protein
MCPEPEFGPEYRALIESYRLAPEVAAGQLDTILERFFNEDRRKTPGKTKTEKKGSTPK